MSFNRFFGHRDGGKWFVAAARWDAMKLFTDAEAEKQLGKLLEEAGPRARCGLCGRTGRSLL